MEFHAKIDFSGQLARGTGVILQEKFTRRDIKMHFRNTTSNGTCIRARVIGLIGRQVANPFGPVPSFARSPHAILRRTMIGFVGFSTKGFPFPGCPRLKKLIGFVGNASRTSKQTTSTSRVACFSQHGAGSQPPRRGQLRFKLKFYRTFLRRLVVMESNN